MDSNSDKISEPFRLALLGYSRKDFDYITRLVNLIDLGKPLKLSVGDLSKLHNLQCDLVIAILDNISNLDTYNSHVALVKQNSSNPPIVCAAREADRSILESYRIGVKADHIIFMPIQLERFATVIRRLGMDAGGEEGGEGEGGGAPAARTSRKIPALATSALRLGELFVKSGLIKKEELDKALEHQKTTKLHIGDALIDLGIITEDQKLKCLAEQLKTAVAESRQYAAIDLNVAALIPEQTARRFSCVAIEKRGNELVVAAVDVLNLDMLDTLRDTTDMRITAILGKKEDIAANVDRCYRDIASHKDASRLAESLDDHVEYVKRKEKESGDEQDAAAAGAELGIVKLVNILITNAIRDHASDIHIEPMENELLVRYRVDGDMRKAMSPPKQSHNAIMARIKILSDLNVAERLKLQDGRMSIKVGQREIDIRVSVLPTIFGEKAVLRILDKAAFEKNTASLGFSSYDERIFRSQIAKPHGLVIVTGPTGCGKSTTLYSALQAVKNVAKNMVTVEDPVEFNIDGINQVNVNPNTGMTFAATLRSVLKQDPDIVMIGEIRDSETAEIAIKTALTGRLVFSALHASEAASAIARFTDIGIPPLLLGASLNLVVAQRLVRKICPKCKIEYKPSPELIQSLGLDPEKITQLYKGNGCVTCNGTGFSGRTAIFEMLQITKNMRKLILKNASTTEIQEAAAAENMKTLKDAGIELAVSGTTTIEQVLAATIEI
jgi:type IV pilus assembly protein PilB